jgi:hypothetical protein
MGILYRLSLDYSLRNFIGKNYFVDLCQHGDDEIVIIHLNGLVEDYFSLKQVPELDFSKVIQAYYYSRWMVIINSPISTQENLQLIQLFEFNKDRIEEIQIPEIPKPENEDWQITSACIDDQWICIAIASDSAAKIYVIDKRTRKLIATLLDSGIPRGNTETKFYAAIDIKTSGNSLAAVSEGGHIAVWDDLREDQANPTISWEASHEATKCHFSKEFGRVIVSGECSLSTLFMTKNGEKVHDWNHRDLDQEALHHWISQDCRLIAKGIFDTNGTNSTGTTGPTIHIHLMKKGVDGERLVEIKLFELTEAPDSYWETFYTAIIDWSCITFIGLEGLLQLRSGTDHSVKGSCSRVLPLVEGFPFPKMA